MIYLMLCELPDAEAIRRLMPKNLRNDAPVWIGRQTLRVRKGSLLRGAGIEQRIDISAIVVRSRYGSVGP